MSKTEKYFTILIYFVTLECYTDDRIRLETTKLILHLICNRVINIGYGLYTECMKPRNGDV